MERQITAGWRKSSRSSGNGGNCVELGSTPGAVLIRDTKHKGHGPVLNVYLEDWRRFVKSIKG
jgi:hypothetical protein